MPGKKTTRSIITEHLKQAEQERNVLMSSIYTVSEWQLAHNKGMRKAYNTVREDLERHGLMDNPLDRQKEESI